MSESETTTEPAPGQQVAEHAADWLAADEAVPGMPDVFLGDHEGAGVIDASSTTATEPARGPEHAHMHTTTGLSNNKLAMWLFLGSECLLFGGLISTYMLYRGRHVGTPGPAQVYDIPFTSVSSFVLLMSSLTMVLAVNAAQVKDDRNTKLWLTVTAMLGATFVGGQVYEFTSFYHEGLGFTTSLFSSSFFSLTGFHGVHVTVGVIMLLAMVAIISRSKVPGDKAEVIELVGLYWHFVDIVWIVIFTLVYLIPS